VRVSPYYPGGAYVDWIGADTYNFANCRGNGGTWRSLTYLVAPVIAWIGSHAPGKPLMLPEWGSVEGAPGQKAAWFSAAESGLKSPPYTQLKAMVYWNHVGTAVDALHCDFRITSSASSLSAFKAMVNDPYFTG
jgi:beta-mannanase